MSTGCRKDEDDDDDPVPAALQDLGLIPKQMRANLRVGMGTTVLLIIILRGELTTSYYFYVYK